MSVASDVRACGVSSSLRLLLNALVLWKLGPNLNGEASEDLARVLEPNTRRDRTDKSSTVTDRQARGLAEGPGPPRRSQLTVDKEFFCRSETHEDTRGRCQHSCDGSGPQN